MNPVAEIRTLARQLALTHLAQRPFDFLSEPVSNEQFLLDCLRGEVAYREQKAQELKAAMTALDAAIAREASWAPLQPGWQRVRSTLVSLADDGLPGSGGPGGFPGGNGGKPDSVPANARVAQAGSPQQVVAEPADEFVADFLGLGAGRDLRRARRDLPRA